MLFLLFVAALLVAELGWFVRLAGSEYFGSRFEVRRGPQKKPVEQKDAVSVFTLDPSFQQNVTESLREIAALLRRLPTSPPLADTGQSGSSASKEELRQPITDKVSVASRSGDEADTRQIAIVNRLSLGTETTEENVGMLVVRGSTQQRVVRVLHISLDGLFWRNHMYEVMDRFGLSKEMDKCRQGERGGSYYRVKMDLRFGSGAEPTTELSGRGSKVEWSVNLIPQLKLSGLVTVDVDQQAEPIALVIGANEV
jgi:hypothetical protein